MSIIISKGNFLPAPGILGIILTGVLVYINLNFCENLFKYQYFQIDILVFAVAIFVCTLYFLIKAFAEYKAVDVYDKHLIIKWLFGLISVKIEKSEILAYGFTTKYKTNYLYIKTEKQVYLFIENITVNDHQLFVQLKTWEIPRKDEVLKNKIEIFELKFQSIFFITVGICILTGAFLLSPPQPPIVKYENLFLVEGHLKTGPSISYDKFRRETPTVTFELSEYPGLRFKIYNFVNPTVYFNTFGRFQNGQQAIFMITLNDYNKKIIQIDEPSFREKHFFWPEITVYEAIINKNTELKFNTQNYEDNTKSGNTDIWTIALPLLISLIFVGFGINKMKKAFRY